MEDTFSKVAKEWGPWVGITVALVLQFIAMQWFFMRQNSQREARMGQRLDEQQNMITTTLLTALKESTSTLAGCKVELQEANDLRRETLILKQRELDLLEGKAVPRG